MILEKRKKYLQIALNSDLIEAERIIRGLPISEQIIIEAGTPLIKTYGVKAITKLKEISLNRILGGAITRSYQINSFLSRKFLEMENPLLSKFILGGSRRKKDKPIDKNNQRTTPSLGPYIIADIKCDDLARKEVEIIAKAGASAATCLGVAPSETIDSFIEECQKWGIDSMVDMMNVDNPLLVLKKLKKPPDIVVLHRGVDESEFNKEKRIPYYQIQQMKGNYDVLISVAGGDSLGDVEQAFFNDADIVIVWKSFYKSSEQTAKLAQEFYRKLKIR